MKPLRIFIGYDSRYPIAYHVAAHSIIARASVPVSITPLVQDTLRASGLYWREKNPLESTEFSLTRFLVPYLSEYEGLSLFVDSDVLFRDDVAKLFGLYRSRYAVMCCQHNYEPTGRHKFLGEPQTRYPKKNWSSVMLFENSHCEELSYDYVNQASALDLHRFNWAVDEEVGALPLEWNWLVGEYLPNTEAKILHYTLGGPFNGVEDCDHSNLWNAEHDAMLAISRAVEA